MKLKDLQESLIKAKQSKEQQMKRWDHDIKRIEASIQDFSVEERLNLEIGEAVILNHVEKFLVVIKHLLSTDESYVGFKDYEVNGSWEFSVRLNLIEQLLNEYYGAFECDQFRGEMMLLLKQWRRKGMPISYRRTSSIDLAERQSNKYRQTYAIEMSVSTFENMFDRYIQSNGNEVWRWSEQHKLQ